MIPRVKLEPYYWKHQRLQKMTVVAICLVWLAVRLTVFIHVPNYSYRGIQLGLILLAVIMPLMYRIRLGHTNDKAIQRSGFVPDHKDSSTNEGTR